MSRDKLLLNCARVGTVLLIGAAPLEADEAPGSLPIRAPEVWSAGVGEGFRAGAMEVSLSAGAGYGARIMGSRANHHWWLTTFDLGYVLTDVVAPDRWYAGNLELLGELFGGEQFDPSHAYLVGGGPHFRYNFVTHSRWVPFLQGGAGLTCTDIRNGDLSTTFEFNIQAGAGVRMFVSDNLAVTLQYRFIHISNAGMQYPNLGVNNSTGLIGVGYLF